MRKLIIIFINQGLNRVSAMYENYKRANQLTVYVDQKATTVSFLLVFFVVVNYKLE